MTLYALCPNCGHTILDNGESRFIACDKCGRKLRSRVYDRNITIGLKGAAPVNRTPNNIRTSTGAPSTLAPLRAVAGFLCSITILSVIIIFLVNFIVFFPAIAITAPELVAEHSIELKYEIPIVIDNTPPTFYNPQNQSIETDDKPPEVVEQLTITPLTINRNKTFQNRLKENNYYRGELVRLDITIYEEHLAEAYVILKNQSYHFVPISDDQITSTSPINYRTILSLPTTPGKYNFQVFLSDHVGNTEKSSHEIHIARVNFDNIDVPILSLDLLPQSANESLPLINSSTMIRITNEARYKIKLQTILKNDLYSNTTSNRLARQESIIINNLPAGKYNLTIQAKVTYYNQDRLFFTFPYPPYLFFLPIWITGWALLGFFILIALGIILSNLYLFKTSLSDALIQVKNAILSVRAPMMESRNSTLIIAQLFLAVYSFTLLYNLILAWSQVPVRTPDFSALSTWTLIYNLTNAAVYEEIITRILLIGIPLFIIHALTRQLKNPKRNYVLGGGFELNKLTVILIIFSSITFGLAHAPSWDYWKVVPTFVSGFALGYLFIRFGVFASIMLHFTVNFLSIPLFITNYPLIPSLIFIFIICLWVFIGIIYFLYYLSRIGNIFKSGKKQPAG